LQHKRSVRSVEQSLFNTYLTPDVKLITK
jgi:hypothetical protein